MSAARPRRACEAIANDSTCGRADDATAIASQDAIPWKIHCDGSALPRRGAIAVGAVLIAPDGTRHTISRLTGACGCNNEAEASALIAALRAAEAFGARVLDVACDSTIIVDHTIGGRTTAVARLAILYAEARALLDTFDRVVLRWIPRRQNGEADALARAAHGLAQKPSVAEIGRRRAR